MNILIKNGTVVTHDFNGISDVLITDGQIARVDKHIEADAERIIDAEGMLIFPGFIDTHTHLDMESSSTHTADDFESGTAAAVTGGTTTVLDFATQTHGHTLMNALSNWHKLADGKSCCDYGSHMAITFWNDEIKKEIPALTREGVTSYKLYMAYDNLRVTDAQIYEILKAVKTQRGIVGMHCENGDLVNELISELLAKGETSPKAHPKARPDTVEEEAIYRYLEIARLADTPVNVVHLSTEKGLRVIERAREKGQTVYVETCPQYLLLNDEFYNLENFESAKYVMSPPLRKPSDERALWRAVEDDEIDTIGSDHCPFRFEQKKIGIDNFSKIPNGAPGVDVRAQLIYTYGVDKGRISPSQFVRLVSYNAARLFGMYPKKGAIEPGSDADVVIWDPEYKGVITDQNQHTNADYTPYNGTRVKGRAKYVFLRGQNIVEDGEIISNMKNRGEYVFRGPCQFFRD